MRPPGSSEISRFASTPHSLVLTVVNQFCQNLSPEGNRKCTRRPPIPIIPERLAVPTAASATSDQSPAVIKMTHDQLELLYTAGPNVAAERVSQLLSLATTLCSQESSDLGLPDFPVDNLLPALHVLNAFPMLSSQQLLHRLYPYNSILGKDGRTAVEGVLSRFELLDGRRQPVPGAILSVSATRETEGRADVTSRVADKDITFQVPAGTKERRPPNSSPEFIRTPSHCQLLSEMMQSHMVKDICLIGAKGCGKSVLAREFAEMLGYSIEPVMLYQDMTARDLLQQRCTLPNGDTAWRPSPLVTAAIEGKLLLLDGIHRVNLGTLAVLSR
ncbi:hypothetical protein F2P81_021754 [Scophthalmus maximus]|uniref:ATPase dynein-related AAA domain-containing protein n=1 Tax=Scophthalmus maximus TaxID=52904 RepID=A0A6A4S1Z5_SCOMX|nr:hypothetical protein F2P81_021754 [Scophthalmus maximus]